MLVMGPQRFGTKDPMGFENMDDNLDDPTGNIADASVTERR